VKPNLFGKKLIAAKRDITAIIKQRPNLIATLQPLLSANDPPKESKTANEKLPSDKRISVKANCSCVSPTSRDSKGIRCLPRVSARISEKTGE
jgi:hypothetical protein